MINLIKAFDKKTFSLYNVTALCNMHQRISCQAGYMLVKLALVLAMTKQ